MDASRICMAGARPCRYARGHVRHFKEKGWRHVPTRRRNWHHVLLIIGLLSVLGGSNTGHAQGSESAILDIAWSPNGEMLATVDRNGTLNVTLPSENILVVQFVQSFSLNEATVEWSLQGDFLAVGIGNLVSIWDSTTWNLRHQFIAGDSDGVTNYYSTETSEGIINIRWSTDGQYIVTGSLSYVTTVWSQSESRIVYQGVDASSGGPGRVWLSNNGWMSDGVSRLNAFTGELFRANRSESPNAFLASAEGASTDPRPDNTQLAWGTVHGELLIVNAEALILESGIRVKYNTDPNSMLLGIADISWDSTWNFIAVASRDGELYVVNLITEEVASVFNIDGQLTSVDWNPQTNQVTYAGVSSAGEAILETVDVSGVAGVPEVAVAPAPTQASG
ncbi:MAG: WD40 repeat domain-containing protein [Pleurocapsa minor GSE-CHR-MK-17-07R]|jgi:WD40 repeat protein|nr:WD40 repeat domain-containing protein [Pleurocapsa minor GSE-CHR-MK 17-07R]